MANSSLPSDRPTAPPPARAVGDRGSAWGAVIGSLAGATGWAWGLIAVALWVGAVREVFWVWLIGMLLSLALGLPLTAMALRQGRGGPFAGLAFVAGLLTTMGVLVLYVNLAVAPVIEGTPVLAEALGGLGSVWRAHAAVPAALLLGACVLWCVVGLRMRRLARVADRMVDAV